MSLAQKQAICLGISRGLARDKSSCNHEIDLRSGTDPSSSFILPCVEISREELSRRLRDCFTVHGSTLPVKNLMHLLNNLDNFAQIPEGKVPIEQIIEVRLRTGELLPKLKWFVSGPRLCRSRSRSQRLSRASADQPVHPEAEAQDDEPGAQARHPRSGDRARADPRNLSSSPDQDGQRVARDLLPAVRRQQQILPSSASITYICSGSVSGSLRLSASSEARGRSSSSSWASLPSSVSARSASSSSAGSTRSRYSPWP